MDIEYISREEDDADGRWPIRPAPFDGELLASWVNRLAVANGMPPWHMHELLGQIGGPSDRQWAHSTPSSALAQYLADHTGENIETVLRMAAVQPAHLVPRHDLFATFAAAHPRVVLRNRKVVDEADDVSFENAYMVYCPSCLAEDDDPWFRQTWRSRLAVGCTHHGLRLLHSCPSCNRHVHPHLSKDVRSQCCCAYCGADLREAKATALSAREKADITDTQIYLDALLGTLPIEEIAAKGEELLRRATRVLSGTGHFWHLYFGPNETGGGLEWMRRPSMPARDGLALERAKERLTAWDGSNPVGLGSGRLIGYANRYAVESYFNKLLDQQVGALRMAGVQDSLLFIDHALLGEQEERQALRVALSVAKAGDTLVCLGMEFLGRSMDETMQTIALLRQRGIHLWLPDIGLHTGTETGRVLLDMVAHLNKAQERRKMAWRHVAFMAKGAAGLCQYGAERALSPEDMRQAGQLLKAGVRVQDIAERFGIALSTVRKWRAEMLAMAEDDIDTISER